MRPTNENLEEECIKDKLWETYAYISLSFRIQEGKWGGEKEEDLEVNSKRESWEYQVQNKKVPNFSGSDSQTERCHED